MMMLRAKVRRAHRAAYVSVLLRRRPGQASGDGAANGDEQVPEDENDVQLTVEVRLLARPNLFKAGRGMALSWCPTENLLLTRLGSAGTACIVCCVGWIQHTYEQRCKWLAAVLLLAVAVWHMVIVVCSNLVATGSLLVKLLPDCKLQPVWLLPVRSFCRLLLLSTVGPSPACSMAHITSCGTCSTMALHCKYKTI